jgi:hypothetical protein
LSRPLAWHIAAEDAMAFLLTALERRPEDSLEDVHIWVGNAALGLVRGLIAEQASSNLQLLLGRLLLCAWLRSEHFPMVLSGIRVGVAEVGECPDPVAPVLRRIHKSLVERHGHPAAASLLMSLAHAANDADRQLVAEIILTS